MYFKLLNLQQGEFSVKLDIYEPIFKTILIYWSIKSHWNEQLYEYLSFDSSNFSKQSKA